MTEALIPERFSLGRASHIRSQMQERTPITVQFMDRRVCQEVFKSERELLVVREVQEVLARVAQEVEVIEPVLRKRNVE
jgi:hypothetical protein